MRRFGAGGNLPGSPEGYLTMGVFFSSELFAQGFMIVPPPSPPNHVRVSLEDTLAAYELAP